MLLRWPNVVHNREAIRTLINLSQPTVIAFASRTSAKLTFPIIFDLLVGNLEVCHRSNETWDWRLQLLIFEVGGARLWG